MERLIGRHIKNGELVHHVNGDSLCNTFDNLDIMDSGRHIICHHSLESCIGKLYRNSVVGFDVETGIYYLI